MTVITKVLGEKKDVMDVPLVLHEETQRKDDVESGRPLPPQPTRYIVMTRVRPYYTLIFILMFVLLVTTTLMGIFGTEYIYDQYKNMVGEKKEEVYSEWGAIYPLDGRMMGQEALEQSDVAFQQVSKFMKDDELNHPGPEGSDVAGSETLPDFSPREDMGPLEIPDERDVRFIHDFMRNITSIVDFDHNRCFIFPLDRNVMSPPSDLYDLITRMGREEYSVDVNEIRRHMSVVRPAIEESDPAAKNINRECRDMVNYKLEEKTGSVAKRSVDDGNFKTFSFLHGKTLTKVLVDDIPEPVVMA